MDMTFAEMQRMQEALQARYKDKWRALSPELAREHLLWLMAEAGEVADIIKKKGDRAIMEDGETRHHFVEELCDVLMYFNDITLCYGITPEELAGVYAAKHRRNLERW